MSTGTTYKYKTKDFVIEDGIIKGIEVPSSMKDVNNYGELILDCLRANPSFVGQIDGLTGRNETFSEMEEKSVKCAMWLREQNIQPEDVVGICTHNQPDMYVPLFGSLYVGAIHNVWWDVGLTNDLAKYFATLTTPKFLFVNEASASIALAVVNEIGLETKVIVFGKQTGLRSLEDILSSQRTELVPEFRCTVLASLDETAVIIFTSGSTGLPKGARHSHRNLNGNINRCLKDNVSSLSGAMALMFSPLSWLTGYLFIFIGVFSPETRIIYPVFSVGKCLQLIEKYKVNWMLMGTSLAIRFHSSPLIADYDLSSLKVVAVGGAVIKEKTQKAFSESFPHTSFYQVYATTELGGTCFRQYSGSNVKQGSCGTICEGLMMKIVDPETGRVLGYNETGEACFKSPFMATSYYQDPEASSKLIDSEGWLHTGDLCFYDEEGFLFFVDRLKEIIKYRGHHVSPTMLEEVLQAHPQVQEAAVVPVPDDLDDEHPIAFVSKRPNAEITEEELEKLVADKLPDYMRLRGGVHFLHELPHTSAGKVARSELKNLAKSYARD